MRTVWTVHSANARAFLTWTMEQFHIGCSATVPARRNLRDFAKFIAETSLDARHLPPMEARWAQAESMMERMRGIPTARPTASIETALA